MKALMNNKAIQHYREHHEKILIDLINTAAIPAPLIQEAISYSLFPGGKRLRPVLVYLCGELLDVKLASLDIIAASIELTHCYSLVHDDLPAMDNDDLRRGQPSCHRAFDEATAILVGDGMQALAIDILLTHLPKSLNNAQVIAVTHALVTASGPYGMVSGQSFDLTELNNPTITAAALRKVHQLKTGKLISACINMVLAASHPTDVMANGLRQFADHLGLLYQMQDDYLDQYDQGKSLGKGRASDTANQKTTFATLYNQDELSQLIDKCFQKAESALKTASNRTDNLRDFMDYLQQRIDIVK